MISIDPRNGSGELAPIFAGMNLEHKVTELPFGDFNFEGNGAKGLGLIGVERKRIRDLLACMVDGRFVGHQLPGMLDYYDHSYLIIEGITRPCPISGVLQYAVEDSNGRTFWRDVKLGNYGRRFMWRDFDGFVTTLEQSKAKVRRTDNPHMTVANIASLYHWFTHKRWDQHDSLRQLYSAPYPVMHLEDKSSLVRRIAKEFDGIGVDKSLSVHMKFRTVWDMITALREEWLSIPGIGATIADRIQRQIHGRYQQSKNEPDETDTGSEPDGG